jgi:hypothetical protein
MRSISAATSYYRFSYSYFMGFARESVSSRAGALRE